jgi:hypothetical protein
MKTESHIFTATGAGAVGNLARRPAIDWIRRARIYDRRKMLAVQATSRVEVGRFRPPFRNYGHEAPVQHHYAVGFWFVGIVIGIVHPVGFSTAPNPQLNTCP